MFIGRNLILWLIGGASFLAVIIGAAPAALIAPIIGNAAPGLSYRSIDGTIWKARISDASVDGVYVGDIRANIALPQLLRAALAYDVRVSGGAIRSDAKLSQSLFGAVEIRDANIEIGHDVLSRYFLLGVPISGNVTITHTNIIRSRNGCTKAEGTLHTNALSNLSQQFGLPKIDLAGAIECVEGKLQAHLAGEQAGMGTIQFRLSELDEFRYRMRVTVTTENDQLKQALGLGGFVVDGDIVTYEEIASWTTPLQPTTNSDTVRSSTNGA